MPGCSLLKTPAIFQELTDRKLLFKSETRENLSFQKTFWLLGLLFGSHNWKTMISRERGRETQRTGKRLPFKSNTAGLALSKLVSRSGCQVRFSIKPEPARMEGMYQKVNSIIAGFWTGKNGIEVLIGNKCQGRWAWKRLKQSCTKTVCLHWVRVCICVCRTAWHGMSSVSS